jgi:hypothetical protein
MLIGDAAFHGPDPEVFGQMGRCGEVVRRMLDVIQRSVSPSMRFCAADVL